MRIKTTDRVKCSNERMAKSYNFYEERDVVALVVKRSDHNVIHEACVVSPQADGTRLSLRRIDGWRADDYDDNVYLIRDDIERFIDRHVIWFDASNLEPGKPPIDGCSCVDCGMFSPMSKPNDHEGKTFTCFSCRTNMLRRYY